MSERGTPDAKSLRLFVAIELPQEVRDALAATIERLKAAGAVGAPRWVRPESMHITLKFLGATDEEDLPAIVSSLRSAVHGHGPFSLRIGGLGTFGAKRALRVVWVGLEGDADALGALAGSVDEAMVRLHFPLEARPFAAHLTLARVRDGTNQQDSEWLHSVVAKHPVEAGPMFHVDQCVLMESTLQRGGAVYRALATFPLEGGSDMTRVIAIDWSGGIDDRSSSEKIWLADVRDTELVDLYNGYTRVEIVERIREAADETPGVIVGLDFSFSVPERFLIDKLGSTTAEELWADLAARKYDWLAADAREYFWGRLKGHQANDFVKANAFRITEDRLRELRSRKLRPKSVFQIGGAGAVGTGSIRGMEHLATLMTCGFRIWPFHNQAADRPTVVEIYPRFFTQDTTNTSPQGRRAFMDKMFPQVSGFARNLALTSEDSFDAAVSALSMAEHSAELCHLPSIRNSRLRREGIIWTPNWDVLLPEWDED